VRTNLLTNMTQAKDIIDDAMATAMHAMQATVAITLAFAHNMFLIVLLIADWQAIAHTHKHHVNENLQHANRKQRQHDYAPLQQF
jgi:hypothetical protein